MHDFNQSLRYDRRMFSQDIKGSVAYAKALALAGILTKEEEMKIVDGLGEVGREWASGKASNRINRNYLTFMLIYIYVVV